MKISLFPIIIMLQLAAHLFALEDQGNVAGLEKHWSKSRSETIDEACKIISWLATLTSGETNYFSLSYREKLKWLGRCLQ